MTRLQPDSRIGQHCHHLDDAPKTDLPPTYSDNLILLDQYTAKDVENHRAGKSPPTPSTISGGPCPLFRLP